jgi:osmotically-inducible protein OsmY
MEEDRMAEQRRNEEVRNEERRNEELRAQEQDNQARDQEVANDGESPTAQDQSNTETDLAITQAIRTALTGDESLSMSARNVTIITEDRVVTLRGNVNSAAERRKVERHSSVEGVTRIDNALVVSR